MRPNGRGVTPHDKEPGLLSRMGKVPSAEQLRPNARDKNEARGVLAYAMPPTQIQNFGSSAASATVTNPFVPKGGKRNADKKDTNTTPGHDRVGPRKPK